MSDQSPFSTSSTKTSTPIQAITTARAATEKENLAFIIGKALQLPSLLGAVIGLIILGFSAWQALVITLATQFMNRLL